MADDPSDDRADESSNDPVDNGSDDDGPDDDGPDDDGPDDDLPAFPVDGSDVPAVPPKRDPMDAEAGAFMDPDAVDDLPTVTCSRCDREWDLAYELDELIAGNRAVERFAMDHERHTGHYPDGVTPWVANCRICPDGERFLAERPARRFARTHVRHTNHPVDLSKPDAGVAETIRDETGENNLHDLSDPGSDRDGLGW